jgi:hypothetical protein
MGQSDKTYVGVNGRSPLQEENIQFQIVSFRENIDNREKHGLVFQYYKDKISDYGQAV